MFSQGLSEEFTLNILQGRIRCACILILLGLLLAGCINIPLSSNLGEQDNLGKALPLEQGDVIVVDGENARNPSNSPLFKDAMHNYITAGCVAFFHDDTVRELITAILKVNPQPGRFAVRHINEETSGENERLRYKLYVKETFEVKPHIPLYAPPFGVASCGNRTVLEASVWELPTETFMGSFTVSAEGEYTVTAYLLHLVTSCDTQKDATNKLAKEIVQKLTGLKPLESKE